MVGFQAGLVTLFLGAFWDIFIEFWYVFTILNVVNLGAINFFSFRGPLLKLFDFLFIRTDGTVEILYIRSAYIFLMLIIVIEFTAFGTGFILGAGTFFYSPLFLMGGCIIFWAGVSISGIIIYGYRVPSMIFPEYIVYNGVSSLLFFIEVLSFVAKSVSTGLRLFANLAIGLLVEQLFDILFESAVKHIPISLLYYIGCFVGYEILLNTVASLPEEIALIVQPYIFFSIILRFFTEVYRALYPCTAELKEFENLQKQAQEENKKV